jgi:RNA polymerase sigma-70 factor (ECF subfamily)
MRRLVVGFKRRLTAKRRSVLREDLMPLSDESEILLAERLAETSSPSNQLLRHEIEQRVRQAIAQLPGVDREVIVLKHLEELSFEEVAVVFGDQHHDALLALLSGRRQAPRFT